ncbi:heat stress transcription factor A-4b-like [Phragmites australis]|uniref:heat stress transcription factor A-4b-like n=1 Tax=Phragmites australis TaxID=29695 RepID=UPI002D786DDE|nr:heat stress transcription factor A-4b-like [Phragmites australis]
MEAGGGGASSLPPFLSKTYEMVDDPATDAVVAWTPSGTSFVVANQAEFCRDLLPKYFKHNNFSSFVRQLNTYGFRKIDPEQWEFANEDFIRGQRHRLKSIHRRKPIFSHSSHTQGAGPLADNERREYEEEVERLKCDNAALTLQLENNAHKKLDTERRMQELEDKLIFLEDRQKNLIAYVRDIVKAPGFLSSFVQQPDHHGKKRRLPMPISFHQDANTQGNQITHGDLTNSPVHAVCRESFDKMEYSLNSLENFFREASEAFDISYDDGAPGPSSAVVITELHSSGESDPHVPSPPSRMRTSAGVGDSHSSHDVTESTSCAESPPLPQMQSCTDSRVKVSEIDVNLEPAITEAGLSRDQPAEDPPAVAPGVNDGFWQQFLTEQPGSDAHQEAQSEWRDGDSKADQIRVGDRENFWWGKKSVEQMTEKLGHLTSAEKT